MALIKYFKAGIDAAAGSLLPYLKTSRISLPESITFKWPTVFMVSPNRLYLGSLVPMRPDTQEPVCSPMRTTVVSPLWG